MDNAQLKIGFVGGGNMAAAIISGLKRAGHAADLLSVADPDTVRLEKIQAIDAAIHLSETNGPVLESADVVVLAVKPQIIAAVSSEIATSARDNDRLFLSIAAGIRLAALGDMLTPARAIVRAMPNQPALVGAGMTALVATADTTAEQQAAAEYIAAAMGEVAWLTDEAHMDAVTAVSGSGPAYYYLFTEIIAACGEDLGLPAELALKLARQTALGAGLTMGESALALDELRASVTSKGGTTAAALSILGQEEFRAIVERALRAAHDRSIELGRTD